MDGDPVARARLPVQRVPALEVGRRPLLHRHAALFREAHVVPGLRLHGREDPLLVGPQVDDHRGRGLDVVRGLASPGPPGSAVPRPGQVESQEKGAAGKMRPQDARQAREEPAPAGTGIEGRSERDVGEPERPRDAAREHEQRELDRARGGLHVTRKGCACHPCADLKAAQYPDCSSSGLASRAGSMAGLTDSSITAPCPSPPSRSSRPSPRRQGAGRRRAPSRPRPGSAW